MPHYHFDVKGGVPKRDRIGRYFANDADAVIGAEAVARAVATAQPQHPGPNRFVSLIHEDGREVVQVPIASVRFRDGIFTVRSAAGHLRSIPIRSLDTD